MEQNTSICSLVHCMMLLCIAICIAAEMQMGKLPYFAVVQKVQRRMNPYWVFHELTFCYNFSKSVCFLCWLLAHPREKCFGNLKQKMAFELVRSLCFYCYFCSHILLCWKREHVAAFVVCCNGCLPTFVIGLSFILGYEVVFAWMFTRWGS